MVRAGSREAEPARLLGDWERSEGLPPSVFSSSIRGASCCSHGDTPIRSTHMLRFLGLFILLVFARHLLHARWWGRQEKLTASCLSLCKKTSNPVVITIKTVTAQPGVLRALWGRGVRAGRKGFGEEG